MKKLYKPLQTPEQAAELFLRSLGYKTFTMPEQEYKRLMAQALEALED